MGFFDDVKEFFGVGEAEHAETGMAQSASNAASRAQMGDVNTYVANDVEVVRAQQDLQMAKTQLARATKTRDSERQQLQTKLTEAKRKSYTFRQRAQAVGEERTDPNEAVIRDCESKLQIFKFNQWSVDVTNAETALSRTQEKLATAKRSARQRYNQAVRR